MGGCVYSLKGDCVCVCVCVFQERVPRPGPLKAQAHCQQRISTTTEKYRVPWDGLGSSEHQGGLLGEGQGWRERDSRWKGPRPALAAGEHGWNQWGLGWGGDSMCGLDQEEVSQ